MQTNTQSKPESATADEQLIAWPVKDLIPHGEAMVLLNSVVSWHENGLCAELSINEKSLFVEAEGVPAWVGLEYMGQAIAAYAGVSARLKNEPVRIGFLVSSRRYEPNCSHFALGAKLEVIVEAITFETTGLQVFACRIENNGETLVTANLNVYMPDDVAAFMEENTV